MASRDVVITKIQQLPEGSAKRFVAEFLIHEGTEGMSLSRPGLDKGNGTSSQRTGAKLPSGFATSRGNKIKRIKFGAPGGSTYLDHGDKKKRENYWKRHMANPVEKYRIENLIPSAALLSAFLLWGESTDLAENVEMLNGAWQSHAT